MAAEHLHPAEPYPTDIQLDADTLAALTALTEAHSRLIERLDELRAAGNHTAGCIDVDLTVRIDGEPWCVIGYWQGDWSEVIVGDDIVRRANARTRDEERNDDQTR